MGKIYGYARVSTKTQLDGNGLEQQVSEILKIYQNAIIYKESFSGKTMDRPIFKELINKLQDNDILVVTKLDRFCRTVKEGLESIDNLINRRIKIHILNMGIIEDNPIGRLIVTNLLAFAEFERSLIIERTQTGKEIARRKPDFKEGRPKKFTKRQIDNALNMLSINGGNYSYKEVEELLGISKSTLIRANNHKKIDKKS
ncbi:recombinase family protein [Clostridium sardiniense]|uniref:Recombinase family protein n=1 Tax=Clostridium sardiniense TaxID=29369 RepID=A0ABS7L312_CLOSR|nr:recombinase family protein [Clostridium sardiniense]MBY0757466.1 recombinase family protein [Clostridium sardiniense]MDQ0462243.1 DNA invertase Pin-like site-specific DNA recombinase [Clostridium sardiniense]